MASAWVREAREEIAALPARQLRLWLKGQRMLVPVAHRLTPRNLAHASIRAALCQCEMTRRGLTIPAIVR